MVTLIRHKDGAWGTKLQNASKCYGKLMHISWHMEVLRKNPPQVPVVIWPFISLQIVRDTITKYNVLCGDDNHDSYEVDMLPI